jgi:membrane protease YdiL (CAAX protease family)
MSPVALVRRFPLLGFLFFACLFGWSFYIGDLLTGGSGASNLPIGPFFAVLVVLACLGRAELRTWARRIRNWRASPGWYLLAVLAPLAMVALIVAVNHGFGAPWPTSGQLADWPQVPGNFVVMLILVGIGEEAGWTAFVAPILLHRHHVLIAWALAATMRIFWHLPMMFTGELSWTIGLLGNAAFTLLSLLLLLGSDGQWAIVAVWHATLNAASGLFVFTMVSGADEARLGTLLALSYSAVAVAAYLARGRYLTRHGADGLVRETTVVQGPRRGPR